MKQRYIGIKPLNIKGSNNLGMIFELDHTNEKYYCVNWPGNNMSPVCTIEQIQSDVNNGFLKPIDIDGKDI